MITLLLGRPLRRTIFLFALLSLSFAATDRLRADDPPADSAVAEEQSRRRLAVALNYCKASFHRINKYPNERVLLEEQRKILNNLDLSSIDEVDVISLYAGVIDEINQIDLVSRERVIIDDMYKRTFRQKIFLNAMTMGTQVATFNYAGAVQSGVGSWWDYRAAEWGRENDSWKLEKSHLSSLSRKTTSFVETSWKLARTRKIPDQWLVRDIDLEQLEKTLAEKDAETRLRILKRMEPRMQCYPPYYYYVARTEQSLGRLPQASETYRNLQKLQTGHFRRDDMLAAALANLAAIEHDQRLASSADTARAALEHSTEVWEANLVCASILADRGQYAEAEDAVYRNLDGSLEVEASRNSLALLYARSGDATKLAGLLDDGEFVSSLRGPVLVQCAQSLGDRGLSATATRQLLASFQGRVNVTFGRDDLVLTVGDEWQLEAAQVSVTYGGVDLGNPELVRGQGTTQLVYRGILEVGTPWKVTQSTRPIAVSVQFPRQPVVAFDLHPAESEKARQIARTVSNAPRGLPAAQPHGYLLTDIRSERFALAMDGTPARVFSTDPAGDVKTVNDGQPLLKAAQPGILPASRPNAPKEGTFTRTTELGPVELMQPE